MSLPPAPVPDRLRGPEMAALREGARRLQLRRTSQQFEAVFLSRLLESMHKTTMPSGLFGKEGVENDIYQGFMDQAVAEKVAARGGFGVGAMVERTLTAKANAAGTDPARAGATPAGATRGIKGRPGGTGAVHAERDRAGATGEQPGAVEKQAGRAPLPLRGPGLPDTPLHPFSFRPAPGSIHALQRPPMHEIQSSPMHEIQPSQMHEIQSSPPATFGSLAAQVETGSADLRLEREAAPWLGSLDPETSSAGPTESRTEAADWPSSASSAPATSVPAMSAPAMSAPATSAPATSAPASRAPRSSAPASLSPRSSVPAAVADPRPGRAPAGSDAHRSAGIAALDPIIARASRASGVDSRLLKAVMLTESGGRSDAVSRKGAGGLMQLMPDTARALGVRDVMDPLENVMAGARYLGQLLRRFEGSVTRALAAYNAGPTAVERHGGVPPYPETRRYVRQVLEHRRRMTPAG